MPQLYILVFETSLGAPSLSQVEYIKLNCIDKKMASSNQERDKEPMSQRDLASLQKKDRGERKPSDIMVETFVRPGDESWAERAAVSLMRKSASKSKETTPQRDHEMERLRSKESSPAGASACSKESTPSEASKRSVSYDDKINYISGNPFVEVTKGIIHLFKTNMSEVETEMMCMLGVPAKHKTTDLLQLTAPCHQDLEYMRIVHDSSPNQYMVLLKFRSSVAALEFQSVYNGMPYNNLEPEVCSVIPVSGVEQCGESEYYRPSGGGTELPYCTICLDRMDESVSTVLTILCNHRFHSSCLAQWEDPTCPVCRYVQIPEMTQDQLCMDCQSSSDLWICLVCGYVGCGRYAGGHAHQHFLETEHCYSMQLGHNRVWDYVGDNFVHRLVQNTGDGKLVEGEGRGTVEKHHGEAMSEEKMDSLQLEYTYLLTSQLEDQRRYFEKKLGRLEEAAGKELSELTHRTKQTEEDKSALNKELETARKDKIKLESKVSQLCQKLEKLSKEFSEEKQLNKSLRENQEEWQTKLKKTEVQLNVTKEVKDREISDLKDQVRDLMFFLEGRDKVQESPLKNELEEGSIIVAESSEQKSTRKTSKTGKRKKP